MTSSENVIVCDNGTGPAETSEGSSPSSRHGQLADGSSSACNTLCQSDIPALPPFKQHGSGSPEVFAADIREEANLYLQKIYVGQLAVEDAVAMFIRFNKSSIDREKEILSCMIQSFFDRYRIFPRYPQRELNITAALFGLLIKHRLLSTYTTLGIALRCVLEALQKPLQSKMYTFGCIALEQFLDRLVEWPQYCAHILQIPNIRDIQYDLVEFIERTVAWVESSESDPAANVPPHVTGRRVIKYNIDLH